MTLVCTIRLSKIETVASLFLYSSEILTRDFQIIFVPVDSLKRRVTLNAGFTGLIKKGGKKYRSNALLPDRVLFQIGRSRYAGQAHGTLSRRPGSLTAPAPDNFSGLLKVTSEPPPRGAGRGQAASGAWEIFSAPCSPLPLLHAARLEESRKETALPRRKIKGRIVSRGPSLWTGDEGGTEKERERGRRDTTLYM